MSSSPNNKSDMEEASVMSVERHGEDDDEREEEGFAHDKKPPTYLPDSKVLCRDENNHKHYYPAVVKKVKAVVPSTTKEWSFFVHYLGWNSRWDRWASSIELIQDTPANRTLYLKAKERAAAKLASKKRKATEIQQNRKQQRKQQASAAAGGGSNNPKGMVYLYEEFCELPFTLYTVLVDEETEITRKGYDNPKYYDHDVFSSNIGGGTSTSNKNEQTQPYRPARNVHQLPAAVTVRQALQQYQRKRGGSNAADLTKQNQVRKFCNGLGLLFDDALPVCLLYPEERPQYDYIRSKKQFQDQRNCEIYGCEYLLRLIVRLPPLLQAEPKLDMEIMAPMLSDLIVLLQKNRQACFKNSFRRPKYEEFLDWEKDLVDNYNRHRHEQHQSSF